ncbi:unnamed protein product [Sphagnum jensenii]|uniref:Uncharacterized protein n=2 Tax=Sphagnum jensenii TaxID=128206 RepID=A0ABP1AQP0_9BRYO
METKKHFSKLVLPCHIAKIHSEGGVDAAAVYSMFWPKLKDKVVGLVLVQSPYGGNPIAPDILCEGQIADVETCLMEVLICKIIKGDLKALEEFTHEKCKEFKAMYSLPSDLLSQCMQRQAEHQGLSLLCLTLPMRNFHGCQEQQNRKTLLKAPQNSM